jgi:phosphotransferase system  glucose/maltose/N-acetylglucosamine-specific IIC component
VLIKVLYAILVLSFVALVGAGLAMYLRVRRHMKQTQDEGHDNIPKQS